MLRFLFEMDTLRRNLSNLNLAFVHSESLKLKIYSWQEVSIWLIVGP
jgi:hypothetical protein